jgi:hypothetical protein
LENIVIEQVKVMNEPPHVKVNVLVGEFDPRVSNVTTFRLIVVPTAG